MLSAHVALVNQCLPQADTFYKAAISLVPEIPESLQIDHLRVQTEPYLASLICEFTSSLVVAPGHPDLGAFYLVRGLLNAVDRFSWKAGSVHKTSVLLSVLSVLCSHYQRRLPYRVEGIESNDVLYGGNDDFVQELLEYIDNVIETYLEQLAEMGNEGVKQAKCALLLVNHLVDCFELSDELARLITRLVGLADKNKASVHVLYRNTVAHIQNKANLSEGVMRQKYQQLMTSIQAR